MLPWQPIFDRQLFFHKIEFPFTMKKNHFSSLTFYVLAHISVPLLVLITFRSILALSWSFGKIQKCKMADPRWLPFGNYDLITTLYDVITSSCGPKKSHLWTYYLSTKYHCHNVYTCEVMEEGGGGGDGIRPSPPPFPLPPEDKNKSGLQSRTKGLGRIRIYYVSLR